MLLDGGDHGKHSEYLFEFNYQQPLSIITHECFRKYG